MNYFFTLSRRFLNFFRKQYPKKDQSRESGDKTIYYWELVSIQIYQIRSLDSNV